LAAAHFEVRQKNLDAARRILGTSIGIAPRERVFKGYIELELQVLFPFPPAKLTLD
jgi:crooked neck